LTYNLPAIQEIIVILSAMFEPILFLHIALHLSISCPFKQAIDFPGCKFLSGACVGGCAIITRMAHGFHADVCVASQHSYHSRCLLIGLAHDCSVFSPVITPASHVNEIHAKYQLGIILIGLAVSLKTPNVAYTHGDKMLFYRTKTVSAVSVSL